MNDRADLVYSTLHALIMQGALPPGSRLTEGAVSRRLGVSRTPVREAIQRLQHEGYLTVPSNGRRAQSVVSPLTREDARDLVRIVGVLEGLAAYDAAQLAASRRRRLVEQLRDAHRRLRKAGQARPPNAILLYNLDEEFHRIMVEGAATPRLRQLHGAIKPQAERYVRAYVTMLAGRIRATLREHSAIIGNISAGRPAPAERAVLTNWRNAAASLTRVITAHGRRIPR